MNLNRGPDSSRDLSLRAGWVTERETLPGSRAEGAFGALRGDLLFDGASGNVRAGAWTLAADAELGVAAPETGGDLVEDIPRLVTSAFRLRAERPAASGELRLGSVWTRHPGHRAAASSERTLLASWRADF